MVVKTPASVVETRYSLGDIVFQRIVTDRCPGMVTGLSITPGGYCYYVTWVSGNEMKHWEIELTAEYIPDYGTQ